MKKIITTNQILMNILIPLYACMFFVIFMVIITPTYITLMGMFLVVIFLIVVFILLLFAYLKHKSKDLPGNYFYSFFGYTYIDIHIDHNCKNLYEVIEYVNICKVNATKRGIQYLIFDVSDQIIKPSNFRKIFGYEATFLYKTPLCIKISSIISRHFSGILEKLKGREKIRYKRKYRGLIDISKIDENSLTEYYYKLNKRFNIREKKVER